MKLLSASMQYGPSFTRSYQSHPLGNIANRFNMYIPPEGLYFRLQGRASQYLLYSRNGPTPQVWQYKGPKYDDQLFSLLYGTTANGHPGLFAIKGKDSGRVLYARRSPDPRVGHVDGDGIYNDNWFQFEPGTGENEGAFRILCPATEVVFFSRLSQDPNFGNYYPVGSRYGDQYFTFIFEDMVVDRVEYAVDKAQISNQTPEVVAEQNLENSTDREQEMTFSFSQSVTETSKFEYSTGFTVTIGTEFSAGIPLVAESKVSVPASQSNTWAFGTESTLSKIYTASFPVKAGPGQIIHATATVQRAVLNIPYTMYLSAKRNGVKVTTTGTWSGVTTWSLKYKLSPV